MKKFKTTMKTTIFLILLFLTTSLFVNAQEKNRPKNNFALGVGLSMPIITQNSDSENFGSNGSDLYLNFGREVYAGKKGYLTIDAKYLTISNPYSMLDSDVKSINSSSTTSLGVWSGSCDKFKLSSYLIGAGWNNYISKNEKLVCFFKIYLGSSSLISPAETFNSTKGYFVKTEEAKSNSFTYSTTAGISYGISKNISLGFNLEYTKSSFLFDNQKINFSGGSQIVTPYTINYSNLTANTELSFRF